MWFQFITRAYPNRAWRGLYGGRQLQFGNRISEQGGNKYDDDANTVACMHDGTPCYRTRRVWKPNVQHKRLYSEILDEMVPLHVTTYALRCALCASLHTTRCVVPCVFPRTGPVRSSACCVCVFVSGDTHIPHARTLHRCIIRMGGLDHYILKTPDKKLQSTKAQELRARLLARAQEMYEQQQTLAQQEGLIDAADVVEAYAEQGAGQAQDGDLGGDAPRPAASTS